MNANWQVSYKKGKDHALYHSGVKINSTFLGY